MTQRFDENGRVIPVTVISAGPVTVTQVKKTDTDGYNAIQVGFDTAKESRVSKAELGHTKNLGPFRHLKEFRMMDAPAEAVGDTIDLSVFEIGDTVTVTGISKGKGFQGVVKRHGFHGGPRTHGQKHSEREPGSIGGGLRNRVPKGMRMAGRTGSDTVTIKNLKVVGVDTDLGQIFLKGAIPGRRGTLIAIKA